MRDWEIEIEIEVEVEVEIEIETKRHINRGRLDRERGERDLRIEDVKGERA